MNFSITNWRCIFKGHDDVKLTRGGKLAVQCQRCLRVSVGLAIRPSASIRPAPKCASASAATTSAR